jgi:hypothetical protein
MADVMVEIDGYDGAGSPFPGAPYPSPLIDDALRERPRR